MIDFFESKAFNAAAVGVLTMTLSRYCGTSTWMAIVLALLVGAVFLLTFEKKGQSGSRAHIRSPGLDDPTWLSLLLPIRELKLTEQIARPRKWRALDHR
jgi:hypothetical protein